jgi:serine/threonine protein kinase
VSSSPRLSVGPYEIAGELGAGASGRVYLARRPPSASELAVKVVREDLVGDDRRRRRFLHEIRAMRAVDHPNVVPVLEVGVEDEQPYIVMPRLAGESLDRVIATRGSLPLDKVVAIVRDVARGLLALEAAGIRHRDVKPSNVMLTGIGAVLLDLGLAKQDDFSTLTAPDHVVGTLAYTAPEVLEGAGATAESDVYGLACTAFEALTGRPPFVGRRPDVAAGHLSEIPPRLDALRPDVPRGVADVLDLGLEKRPAERPATKAFATMFRMAATRSDHHSVEYQHTTQDDNSYDFRTG